MAENIPVLIVGAGPVGLSLALGLARCGVQSVVVEKNLSTSVQSRAPGVWSRTLEIFDGWGIVDDLLAAGTYIPKVQIWGVGDEEPQVEVSFEDLRPTTPYPGILILPQSKTEAILANRLKDEPLTDVRFSHELLDWVETDDGVEARISTPAGEIHVAASYLIGCDGARSSVRKRLGIKLKGKTYDAHVALADVQIDKVEFPWPRVGTADGPLIALHLGGGRWRIIAIGSEAAQDAEIDDVELDVWVRGVFGDVPYKKVWTSTFGIHSRVCDSFRRKRVILAGDAAHLNSPAGGQGMNSGIQDAHNLAWKLARVLHGGDADKLLDSYDVERRQAIRRYVNRTTDYLTRAIVQGSDLQRSFFARAARTGLNLSPLRRRVLPRMAMLDIRYRDSPLFPIADRRVGLRAPNCLVEGLDGIVRLHDLVREGPCLLRLNATEVKEVAGIKQEILGPSMAPELFEELHVDRKTAILLRPDGFIGLFIENPAQDELAASVAAALGDA